MPGNHITHTHDPDGVSETPRCTIQGYDSLGALEQDATRRVDDEENATGCPYCGSAEVRWREPLGWQAWAQCRACGGIYRCDSAREDC